VNPEYLRGWLALLRVQGLGPVLGTRLLSGFPESESAAQTALAAGSAAWRRLGLPSAVCTALAAPDWGAVDTDLKWLSEPGRTLITRFDPRYPPQLLETDTAPLALFVCGDPDLLRMPQIAIVGARHATPQGIDNARDFSAELATRGLVVTSGLALGVDGAAHRGALDADGGTIAVCGNGLDRVYPSRHRELAHRIAERGLLLSELPPGSPPRAENFPRRNRIISGLSLGVLVVEAARESGSLITARLAGEQGRSVFAIPGSIHNPLARGCHTLIREGARLVETVDDVLEEIAPQLSRMLAQRRASAVPESEPEDSVEPRHNEDKKDKEEPQDSPRGRLLAALGDDPASFDALAARSGLESAELQAALFELELAGEVAAIGSSFMRRGRK